mmetsp:Transcript_52460/g.139654  ORF Transcript_52460/g.139654 Transcript_52460/m.139654 type:complete len:256 (-) Transcript_52460:1489-2256(-)
MPQMCSTTPSPNCSLYSAQNSFRVSRCWFLYVLSLCKCSRERPYTAAHASSIGSFNRRTTARPTLFVPPVLFHTLTMLLPTWCLPDITAPAVSKNNCERSGTERPVSGPIARTRPCSAATCASANVWVLSSVTSNVGGRTTRSESRRSLPSPKDLDWIPLSAAHTCNCFFCQTDSEGGNSNNPDGSSTLAWRSHHSTLLRTTGPTASKPRGSGGTAMTSVAWPLVRSPKQMQQRAANTRKAGKHASRTETESSRS